MKIAFAHVTAGQTIRIVDIEAYDPAAALEKTRAAWAAEGKTLPAEVAEMNETEIAAGVNARVHCGSIRKSSPTRTVAKVTGLRSSIVKGCREIVVHFTTGEVAEVSTRQRVELVEDGTA